MLEQAAAELLSNAKAVKAQMIRPQRIQPLAVVLSRKDDGQTVVAMIAILDLDQRVGTLKEAVRKCGGFGFAFMHDGFISDMATGMRNDAIMTVSGTAWGAWKGTAAPYRYGGLGATFLPLHDLPEVCKAYESIFP